MAVLQSMVERKPYLKTFHFNTDYWSGNHTSVPPKRNPKHT